MRDKSKIRDGGIKIVFCYLIASQCLLSLSSLLHPLSYIINHLARAAQLPNR